MNFHLWPKAFGALEASRLPVEVSLVFSHSTFRREASTISLSFELREFAVISRLVIEYPETFVHRHSKRAKINFAMLQMCVKTADEVYSRQRQ